MRKTLIDKLSVKDIQAMMNTYTLSSFYYPTLFPLAFTPTLKWETLGADEGAPVAADVVAFDSRSPRKRREIVGAASGDIPKISVGRDKSESDINHYNQLKVYANTTQGADAILDWIFDDQEFVWKGVNARLEWLALRAMSTGKITLDGTNNDGGIVTETAVDFLIPAANKSGVSVAITAANAATSKPITLFKKIVKDAKKLNKVINYAFMDQDTADNILASDETIKSVATWVVQATQLTSVPTLAALNTYLKANNLPQIVVIESYVQIEIKGERTLVNPWEAGVIHFSGTPTIGKTWYGPLADDTVESSVALKAKKGHIMIKRYAEEEPLKECCLGLSNAFPSIGDTKGKFLVDTLNTTWTK